MAWPIHVDTHNDKRIQVIMDYCSRGKPGFDKFTELMAAQGFIWTGGPFDRKLWWCWGN